ncbi:MAG: KH domain-containing protein [Methanoregulaceae archaeon]|nr:KH domain-containing protein [Methanoregulaceae archaeon]
MQVTEITAKSLDEAKAQAAKQLGVSVDQLNVQVLEETKGLFGKSNVRIRAEVVEAAPAKPARAPRGKAKAEPAPAPVVEAAPEPEPEPEKPAKPARTPRGRSKPAEAEAPAKPAAKAAAKAEPKADAPAGNEPVATAEDADHFVTLLNDLMDRAELDVNVQSTEVAGKYVNVRLDGKDAGYLVGKHGEVLNSLQYLINIVATQQWGNGVRTVLDGNDFRARREQQLTDLAKKIAEAVLERGEEAVLDALPAFERRLVHKALSEMPGVSTYSEGEEPNRRVVIAPAD